jgi:methyl-accepting chemotaxis protein
MSATSESLSGQAEHLQASIAFFRIDGKAGNANKNEKAVVSKPALPQPKTPTPSEPGTAENATHVRARSRPDNKVRHGNGFALNLNNGRADHLDADFESF